MLATYVSLISANISGKLLMSEELLFELSIEWFNCSQWGDVFHLVSSSASEIKSLLVSSLSLYGATHSLKMISSDPFYCAIRRLFHMVWVWGCILTLPFYRLSHSFTNSVGFSCFWKAPTFLDLLYQMSPTSRFRLLKAATARFAVQRSRLFWIY